MSVSSLRWIKLFRHLCGNRQLCLGARSIAELQANGQFMRVSPASLRESHPHDIVITKEAPNYQVS